MYSFLLQLKYNEFKLKILYTIEVGWKKYVWIFLDFFVNYSYVYR
jgi:hypothetical protein